MISQQIKDTYDQSEWRLIHSGFVDGPSNMAIDEAILEAVTLDQSPPTLRIFGWEPGCLSLGVDQAWDAADFEGCASQGWDVVRGLASSRSILHVDDLSLTVVVPATDRRVTGTDLEPYQRLAAALTAALKIIGLDPDRSRPYYQDRGPLGEACFDGPSRYQVTIGGRKVICGAFYNAGKAVMLQCTIPLFGELARISDALWFDMPGQRLALKSRIGYRAATIESLMGRRVEYNEVSDAIQQGFSKGLNVVFSAGDLSEFESSRASELTAEKYTSESWTMKI